MKSRDKQKDNNDFLKLYKKRTCREFYDNSKPKELLKCTYNVLGTMKVRVFHKEQEKYRNSEKINRDVRLNI